MTQVIAQMAERPPTPTSDRASPENIPSTPPMSRPRSDTILTTSSASSSSSPQLQTPQTPSILGVLDSYNRHRSDSYGFSDFGKTLFPNGEMERTTDTIRDGKGANEDNVQPRNMDREGARVTAPPLEDPAALSTMSDMTLGPSSPEAMSSGEMADTPLEKGKQRASSKVRAKLQRSKSSLRDLLRISNSTSATTDTADVPIIDDDNNRRRPRLRSLLSMSRAPSRASSTTSIRTLEAPVGPQSSLTRLESASVPVTPGVELSDPTLGFATPAEPRSLTTTLARSPDVDEVADSVAIQDHLEITRRRRMRPMPMSALSSSRVLQYTTPAPPITRSVTDPVIVQGTFQTTSKWQDQSKKDLFTTMLPRELKVMILKTMLEMGSEQEREARWDGEVGARKELIRLSRVRPPMLFRNADYVYLPDRCPKRGKHYVSMANFGPLSI